MEQYELETIDYATNLLRRLHPLPYYTVSRTDLTPGIIEETLNDCGIILTFPVFNKVCETIANEFGIKYRNHSEDKNYYYDNTC